MKWSLKLGRWLGIDVYVHFTFLLLLGFVGMVNWMTERTLGSAVTAVIFFTALFGCVLLHEFGHALAARAYGIATRDITLLPIGGLARLERMPEKPIQELWVALAGPAVNVVIAAGLLAGLLLQGAWEPVSSLSLTQGSLLERLLMANVFLTLFNMLPAFPMDGGRVLRALLAMRLPYVRATSVAAAVGKGMAALFGIAGLFGNPMLLFIAVFVWMGAGQEAAAARMKHSFSGSLVRDAMITDFRALSPEQSLGEAARLALAGSQRDFPVVQDGRVLGVLTHGDMLQALRAGGEAVPVAEVMRREFEGVEADASLDSAFSDLKGEKGDSIPVFRQGALVGLLTAENLSEYFMIRSALADRDARPIPPIIRVPPVIRMRPGMAEGSGSGH
jgi:Zn-dependent protease/CBS domain-containing protein